jgi:hypothetical protein
MASQVEEFLIPILEEEGPDDMLSNKIERLHVSTRE